MLQILLVAHGNMRIPPNGWGAVESLIFEYYQGLVKLGHVVSILNTTDLGTIVSLINNQEWDFVHIHNDALVNIVPCLKDNKRIIVTSHYPYIQSPERWNDPASGYNYGAIVWNPLTDLLKSRPNTLVGTVSPKDYMFLKQYVPEKNVFLMLNGVNSSKFQFVETPQNSKRTICLAQIMKRKRQNLLRDVGCVDFIGKVIDTEELVENRYLGEWTDDGKYSCLTQYGNSVLVSDGENGAPLSVKESLFAGLGVVVSEAAASELPRSWSWVTVVTEDIIRNPDLLAKAIEANRSKALQMRPQIREEAMKLWDWASLVLRYVESVKKGFGLT